MSSEWYENYYKMRAAIFEESTEAARSARAFYRDIVGVDAIVRLTVAFIRYARDVAGGRMPASRLDPDWVALRDTLDVQDALAHAIRSARAARRVADLGPTDAEYQALRTALEQLVDQAFHREAAVA